jgi:transposase
MMGTKVRSFAALPRELSLEDLVPEENFYRRLEARLDLSFVRELVAPLYAEGGRPSVDPAVFFKLQLVMFFEGLRSERELMKVAADRLSLRWYLGYDLFEPLADHSSLTRIRERFGTEIFRRFFERIVELLDAAVFAVGNVEVTRRVDSCAPREPELSVGRALHSPFSQEGAVGVDLLDAVVGSVGNVDVTRRVGGYAGRIFELTIGAAFGAPLIHGCIVGNNLFGLRHGPPDRAYEIDISASIAKAIEANSRTILRIAMHPSLVGRRKEGCQTPAPAYYSLPSIEEEGHQRIPQMSDLCRIFGVAWL